MNLGNLCIAGHNYDNGSFFSDIKNLKTNSIIKIDNLKGTIVSYYVYDKYEISSNDMNSVNQNTYGNKEITLITCNNFNGNRLIVKAKEI